MLPVLASETLPVAPLAIRVALLVANFCIPTRRFDLFIQEITTPLEHRCTVPIETWRSPS
jgi:hypothetical protein